MITSILITSSIFSLLFLFAFAHFFLHKLKKEWMKSLLKLWIDFSFVYLVVAICMITIPMQVYDTLLLGLFLFFVLFFYVLQPISPGSFILIPKKITDPIKLAKIKEKKKGFYKSLIAYSVLMLMSMVVGMGYLLDNGSFGKTADEKYMINEDGNILVDMYEDGTYGVGFFDESKDGNFDTIRYDLNGDGVTDVAYSDWEGNGQMVEMVYDGKDQRNMLFVFWFAIFFVLFMYLTFKPNKGKGVAVAAVVLLVFLTNVVFHSGILFAVDCNSDNLSQEEYVEYFDWIEENGRSVNEDGAWEDYCGAGSTESRASGYDDLPNDYFDEYDSLNEADSDRCRGDYQDDRVLCNDPYGYNENPYSSNFSSDYNEPSEDYEVDNGNSYNNNTSNGSSAGNSNSGNTTSKPVSKPTPKPRQKTEAEIAAEKKAWEEKRKKDMEVFKKEMEEGFRQEEIKNNTIEFIDNSASEGKTPKEILGTIDRKNLTKKQLEQYDAFDKEIGWYKAVMSFNKDILEEVGKRELPRQMQGILNTNGIKSIELKDRIQAFDSKIDKMMKKNNVTKYGSTIKSHKKATAGLRDFQKKNMSTWQKKSDAYVGRKNALGKMVRVVGAAADVFGAYTDYNDYNREFKDPSKAVAATVTQNIIGKVVSANPVDLAVGIVSAGLSIIGADGAAQTIGEYSAGAITKNAIKDSFTTGFGEMKDIAEIQYDNFKKSEGFVEGTKTAFVGTVTTGYTATVAVAKPVLEVASMAVGGAGSMASAAVRVGSKGVKSIVSGIKSWF